MREWTVRFFLTFGHHTLNHFIIEYPDDESARTVVRATKGDPLPEQVF